MRPTWRKVYFDPLVHSSDSRAKRKNVDLKIDERYLVPVEKLYTGERMKNLQRSIQFTRQLRGE